MLMVGSLVYLFIEIFYRGPHEGRLRWVFGLFTLATVLVSRIAIEEGLERASLFGLGLGVATLVTAMNLVDFAYGAFAVLEPAVLLLFILVVMWSANRLTWDCTLIDSSRDVTGIGLLDILKRKLSHPEKNEQVENSSVDREAEVFPEKSASAKNRFLFLLFAGSNSSNTPGLWVLYFSLAAFPIFGFGQWFAQRDPETGFLLIFLLFALYLGAGLGLLMLTSLLSLERYLRKRGAQMPPVVMGNWLLFGSLFALAIMLAVVLMPRPDLSSNLDRSLAYFFSPIRDTSKLAVGDDGQQQGDRPAGRRAADQPNVDVDQHQGENRNDVKDPSGDNGKSSSPSNPPGSDSDSQTGSANGSKDTRNSSAKSPGSKPQNPDEPASKSPMDENGVNTEQKPGKQKAIQQAANDPPHRDREGKDAAGNRLANVGQEKQADANLRKQQPDAGKGNRQPASELGSRISRALATTGRFLSYLIGVLIIAILVWMFRKELAQFWQQLFQEKQASTVEERLPAEEARKPLQEFRSFREPFQTGLAVKWSNAQTIQYTLAALEAFARERNQVRDDDQTPFEFANQLGELDETLALEARKLAELHGRCFFDANGIGKEETRRLATLWQLMIRESAATAI